MRYYVKNLYLLVILLVVFSIKTASIAQDELSEITAETDLDETAEDYVEPDCYWKKCFDIEWRTPDLSKVRDLSPNLISEQNRWPIHYAALNCSPRAVFNILGLKGALVNLRDPNTNLTPLQTALVLCNRGTVAALLDLGADVNEEYVKGGGTTLHFAIAKELSTAIIKMLIDNTTDINREDKRGYTPLMYFLVRGDMDLVNYILDAGASPNVADINGYTPVHYAAEFRDIPLLRKLRNLGADFNVQTKLGRTALHMLAAKGITAEEVALFRYAEIDPNVLDNEGRAPVHYAAAQTPVESIVALLVLGVPTDLEDSRGDTPLHYALRYNPDSRVVENLLKVGANPNKLSSSGEIPSLIAIYASDNISVVDKLVEYGASPNVADENGRTLLHHAIIANNPQIASNLIENGADPYKADKLGNDAFRLAKLYNVGSPLSDTLQQIIQAEELKRKEELAKLQEELKRRQEEFEASFKRTAEQKEIQQENRALRRTNERSERNRLRQNQNKISALQKRLVIARRSGNEKLVERYENELSNLEAQGQAILERIDKINQTTTKNSE